MRISVARNAALEDSTKDECKSERYVMTGVIIYLQRLVSRYDLLDTEFFDVLHWLIGSEMLEEAVLKELAPCLKERDKQELLENIQEEILDRRSFSYRIVWVVRRIPRHERHHVTTVVCGLLRRRLSQLEYVGKSNIEERLSSFRQMFQLSELEIDILCLLFIMEVWEEVQHFFEYHLKINKYPGRHFLMTALATKNTDLVGALNGRLSRLGIVESDWTNGLSLESGFGRMLQSQTNQALQTEFFECIDPSPIPLSDQAIDPVLTGHLLDLLRQKPVSSTHILLYGPPGSGKTSYAYGLGKELGLQIFAVNHGTLERESARRAAFTACVNMIRETDKALAIADDSDLVLGTRDAWQMFGGSSERKWLHDVLETPAVRMIWIVNSTHNLEQSVIRRFAFSLRFTKFNRSQRIRVWQSSLREHKLKRFFDEETITQLAGQYDFSPGVIEQSVRKAKEMGRVSSKKLHEALNITLEAHETLAGVDRKGIRNRTEFNDMALEGLNIVGTDMETVIRDLEHYDEYLRKNDLGNSNITMAILFHGPPGTGKSHLAKYIAYHLDRESVCKRTSDLFSKWVGETEQRIRDAYEEARRKQAVLIFDEAESLIFSRDRAFHSWELSFTNEFLTWMEQFQGIQIFTTNRLTDLDAAGTRRFTIKLEFGYLNPEGNISFYSQILAPFVAERAEESVHEQIRALSDLAPGDFNTVRNRFAFKERSQRTHQAMIRALREEVRIKKRQVGQKSMGFVR